MIKYLSSDSLVVSYIINNFSNLKIITEKLNNFVYKKY